MKNRALLSSLILRGPVALRKRNTGGGLKSFLTLSKFRFFWLAVAVVTVLRYRGFFPLINVQGGCLCCYR